MNQLKIVQMDLARQKENLAEIFKFFDFAKKYGYDTVALYLEDRIKTKCYPYASDEESYSVEEVGKITAYADTLGLELIPVVSNFAHTERFLEHKELSHLSELRNGGSGLIGRSGIDLTACPLLPEAQEFFDTYFSEVAALFPKARYFHAGLDEDFDIGSCELCKADVREHGGMGHLFLNLIKRTNALINSFGKEMIMWDDMLVYCPEIIPEIPKNVIMCSWCYDFIDPYPRSPFANSKQTDLFHEYDKVGLRYMPAVWCNLPHNVDSYTKYASNYSPMGYYNTTWGMSEELLLFVYPLIAYTGLLWSGKYVDDPIERMKVVVRDVIGAEDPMDIAILTRAVEKPTLNARVYTYYLHDQLVRRNVNFEDEYKDVVYIYDLLPYLKVDNDYVKAIKYRVIRSKLIYEMMIAAQNLTDYQTGIFDTDLNAVLSELLRIKADFTDAFAICRELWYRHRAGISEKPLLESERTALSNLDKLIERTKNAKFASNALLHIQYLLPEKSICGKVTLKVTYTDKTTEEFNSAIHKPLLSACYNIADKGPYFYNYCRLISGDKIPESVEISESGIGNICVQYAFIRKDNICYTPTAVSAYGKYTENAEHLLVNDTRWATIGAYSMLDAMTIEGRWDEVSGIKITLSKS